MGVTHTSTATEFTNRMTVNIDGSTETTSGLTFGARMRLRTNDGDTAATMMSGPRVYVKSGAVEVAMGNIYGAIDSMPNLYHSEVGLIGNGAGDVTIASFDAFSSQGNGVNGVEAIYSAGAFTGHLSFSDTDNGSTGNRTAAHVAYTSGDWTAALGMQDSSVAAEDLTAVTVAGKVGDYGVAMSGMDTDAGRKVTLSGSATFGATSVSAFVSDSSLVSATDTAYGLGVSYDLGGAALVAGIERETDGDNYADMGVSFSF